MAAHERPEITLGWGGGTPREKLHAQASLPPSQWELGEIYGSCREMAALYNGLPGPQPNKSLSNKKELGFWLWLANGKHGGLSSRSLVQTQIQPRQQSRDDFTPGSVNGWYRVRSPASPSLAALG